MMGRGGSGGSSGGREGNLTPLSEVGVEVNVAAENTDGPVDSSGEGNNIGREGNFTSTEESEFE
jgi:hypothetical protein